jgi:transcriptional regulator with XRE-family HTH domain
MTGRFRRVDEIPHKQAVVVGANIRVLRQQHGWNQAKLGELMGWPSNSTVCAAEGHRNGRQRGFTTQEVERLAAIFGLSPITAHDGVRELRRAPADRVRLPDLRSPALDMRPEFAGRP